MKNKLLTRLKPVIIIIAIATLIFGVPLVINEAYKCNTGYLTLWSAADVLAYYGMIVAAIIGIVGVYITVRSSVYNYRIDARDRILPYVAIEVMNICNSSPLMEDEKIVQECLSGANKNHIFYILDGISTKSSMQKVRATDWMTETQRGDKNTEIAKMGQIKTTWLRGKDGKMYIRNQGMVSMPFVIENIGNGPAKNLSMSFIYLEDRGTVQKREIILKQGERFYIHIFSEKPFEEIKGSYTFMVCYEDIAGNKYEQLYPVEIVEENGNRYNRIDTNGKQNLIIRAK